MASSAAFQARPPPPEASPFTLVVTDNQGATANAKLSITVTGTAVTITVTLHHSSRWNGRDRVFTNHLPATGGQSPYTFALTAGTLPAGPDPQFGGAFISGTPTATATVRPSPCRPLTRIRPLVQPASSLAINATAPLTVTTATLPNGTIGTAYSQTLAATGGQTPYTWALGTGTLPAGVTLSSAGVISGTLPPPPRPPRSPCKSPTQRKHPRKSRCRSQSQPPRLCLLTSPTTLPAAVVGVVYTQKLTAAGGVRSLHPSPWPTATCLTDSPSPPSTATISGTAPARPEIRQLHHQRHGFRRHHLPARDSP